MKGAYYNEFDPKAAAWLKELIAAKLIPAGEVDERSICDVQADDVRGFVQRHWYAGVGGWAYALRLAGWPEDKPIDTLSCPCPPFSCAGKKKLCPVCGGKTMPHPYKTGIFACIPCGHEWLADARHLWPESRRLIADLRPAICVGEQVSGADGLVWLAGVRATLEELGYGVGAGDICSPCVQAPNIRQRLYWMARRLENAENSNGWRQLESGESSADGRRGFAGDCEISHRGGHQCLANSEQPRLEGHSRYEHDGNQSGRIDARTAGSVAAGGAVGGVENGLGGGCCQGRDGQSVEKVGATLADDGSSISGLGNSSPVGCEVRAELYGELHGDGSGEGRQPCSDGLGVAHSARPQPGEPSASPAGHGHAIEPAGGAGGVGDTERDGAGRGAAAKPGAHGSNDGVSRPSGSDNFWSNFRIIPCRDGKARRIPVAESVFQLMAAGLSAGMGDLRDSCGGQNEEEKEIIMDAIGSFPLAGKVPGRTPLLKGAGNAINAVLAAEFIKSVMEIE